MNIKADWDAIIEASRKKPASILYLKVRTDFSELKKSQSSKLRTTPTKHILMLFINGKVNFPPLYFVVNLKTFNK